MLKNAKIAVKLSVGFGVLVATILAISIISIIDFTILKNGVINLVEVKSEKLNAANAIYVLAYKASVEWERLAQVDDIREMDAIKENIADNTTEVDRNISILSPLIPDRGTERELYNNFTTSRQRFRETLNTLEREAYAGNMQNVRNILDGEYNTRKYNYLDVVSKIADYQKDDVTEFGHKIEDDILKTIIILWIVIAIGIIVAIIFSVVITRMITLPLRKCVDIAHLLSEGNTDVALKVESKDETGELTAAMQNMVESIKVMYKDTVYLCDAAMNGKLKTRADIKVLKGDYQKIVIGINNTLDAIVTPINEAMKVMDRMAHKDLTVRVTGKYKGDLDTFKENINLAADTLEDALQQVDMAVEQISAASGQISSGSQGLAEATSEQASSLEEITASLNEINSLTGNNADNAKSGSKLADEAVKAVDSGNQAMEKMNKAMESILKSSQETGKIIKTIDEIAFQTNLLALNAAVEAAHAGDAGKGFAVVAEEVKNLALRSAEAAKNTNVLIEEASHNSQSGSHIVEQVANSFVVMKEQFNKVKLIVNEISASSDEQAHGVNQISTGVHEMNKVTQQNAANAEESAAAAEQLNGQAAELKSMVNSFTLTKSSSRHSVKHHAPAVAPPKAIAHKKPGGYEVKPENILPLDSFDDDDFADF
jgi:methyl-accepting chemotaxis protein